MPLAATDNLNFGNPERPEIMGQLVMAIKGIGEACRALDFPIVSGNVSLYNETNGRGILPTPTIGGVGLIADWAKMARIGFAGAGPADPAGRRAGRLAATHLGQSIYLRDIHGRDATARRRRSTSRMRRRVGDFVRSLIRGGIATAVHDLSDGGLAVGAGRNGDGLGHRRRQSTSSSSISTRSRSSSARIRAATSSRSISIPTAKRSSALWDEAKALGILAPWIGTTGGAELKLGEARAISVDELKAAHESWFPALYVGRLAASELTSPTLPPYLDGTMSSGGRPWRWTRTTSRS